MLDIIVRYSSRKYILAAAAFIIGVLQTFGVAVPQNLSDKIVGAVIAVAAMVSYFVVNFLEKKAAPPAPPAAS